jgi:hypothetical protein
MKPPVKRTILVAVLVSVTGGWMAFDGAHALITGDFVTPSSGPYSGQLGPWATLLEAVGLEHIDAASNPCFNCRVRQRTGTSPT